jgi:hypothetical protein
VKKRLVLWLSSLLVSGAAIDHLGAQQMAPGRFRPAALVAEMPTSLVFVAPSDTPSTRIPPAARSLIASQVIGGFLGAVIGGLGPWYLVDASDQSGRKVKGDWGYSPNANTAYAVGSWAGASTLSYLLGQADGSHASMTSTALGAGLATLPLLLGREEPFLPIVGVVLVAPLQSAFAAVGYHKTRRGPR